MAANWTAFVAGNVLTAAQLNGVVDNFADIAIFNETQSSGTNGGTYTASAYVKRTLNTTVLNNIAGCSISTSVITLAAGTYQVLASCPCIRSGNARSRLYDTTNTTTLVQGPNEYVDSSAGGGLLTVSGVFTLAGSTNMELQMRGTATLAGVGLGSAVSSGEDEIYSQITIVRIA